MAGFDVIGYSASRKYTEETVEGAGAIKGKNCVIDSIDDITGGHKVNFKWTLDDGTELEGSMEVMNGHDGVDGQDGAPGKDGDPGLGIKSVAINSNNHLIVTYDDDTTQDAGEIPSAGGTGDYEQLDNLPSIAGVQLIGNITLAQLGIVIPTSTSDLTNDSGFITNAVNDLVNYYKKTETYTKEEVQQLIQAIPQMHIAIVQQLPTEDISTSTIYFVPKQTQDTNDVYDEYMYISNAWEHIGSTAIDLSNYYTKTQVDTLLAAKANAADVYTKSQVDTAISEVEDTVDSLSTAQSELAEDVETLGSEVAALAAKEHTGTYLAEVGTKEGSALAHTIYGMSVQDGTPTPDSPVEIQSAKADFRCVGKNLIPYPSYQDGNSKTQNGITFTVNSDGTVTVNGTATAAASYNCIIRLPSGIHKKFPNGSYHASGCPSGSSGIRMFFNHTVNGAASDYLEDRGNGGTFTVNGDDFYDDGALVGVQIYISSGYTINNLVFKPMITLADVEDSDYEHFAPYQHTDVTTNLTLRAIEVASTDDYTYERDGKYYIADTIDWSEDEGYQITRRVGHTLLPSLTYVKDGSRFVSEVLPVNDNLYSESSTRLTTFLCSSYLNSNTANEGTCFIGKGVGNAKKLYIYTSQYSTLSDFVASLTSADYIVYPLSVYSTEPITSEQAQALLSLKTYDEATSISATGDIEPSVDLEYATSEISAKALTGHNEAYIAQELEGIYGVKNLIPYPYYDTSKTINGLTFTDNGDGSVTINGTCTDQTFYQLWGGRNNLITTYFLTENENYIMTLDVDGDINLSSGDCVLSFRTYPQNSTTPYQDVFYITKVTNNIRKQFTFTQPDGYIYSLLWLEFRTGAVLNNVTINPMLRLASIQSDEYQPYAMSNYELTKKIKELETALIELSSQ